MILATAGALALSMSESRTSPKSDTPIATASSPEAEQGGNTNETVPAGTSPLDYERLHSTTFFEKESFWSATKTDDLFTLTTPILGATVPHHLIPSPAIATLFRQLQKQNPKTLIILSPNHLHAGERSFLTSKYSYPTPLGNVATNQAITTTLLDNPTLRDLITEDDNALSNDHGVGNLIPFIRYYLPETTIVPILVKNGTTLEESQSLAKALQPIISTETPLLTSVDFSHYLTLAEAQKKDLITWSAIKSWSLQTLLDLDADDYLDTPAGVVTLLKTMHAKSATRITKNYYDNSGAILKQPDIPTTSYIIATFTK